MNPQGVYNISGNAPPYNLAEIWPFSGGAGVYGPSINAADDLAASINRKMNMSLNVNLEIPNPIDNRVRRRQDEDACGASTSPDANMNDCTSKRIKAASELNENSDLKEEGEEKKTKVAEQMAKTEEPPKQDYIHVRARRGQATDNHSLAERARREKISEKMKTLQDLVPGCNKVIGKAVVLDEIINYVQSLQRQVEFLSMKLEAVNSRQGTGIEGFPLKDFGQQQFDSSGMQFDPHSSRNYSRGASPEWLHMQIGGGFDINRDTR